VKAAALVAESCTSLSSHFILLELGRVTATDLLYQTDSYLREFDAKVVEVAEQSVVLDRTAFYPRGGGQMSDRGILMSEGRTYPVIAVEKRGDLVYHTVDGPLPENGTMVHGSIDWDFRYQMMRSHSAIHVLCGVVYQKFGILVTGNQMYPDRFRVDLALPDLKPERLAEIERLCNEAVEAGYPVKVRFMARAAANRMPELIRTKVNLVPPEVDPVRTVEIVGLDVQTDGGTHVANTMEIGRIRIIKTENKGRENRRLEFELSPLVF
jgi:misacylated tRNA(Ala) deacylase